MDLFLEIVSAEKHCFEAHVSCKTSPGGGDAECINLPTDFWGDPKFRLDETVTDHKVVEEVIVGSDGFIWS